MAAITIDQGMLDQIEGDTSDGWDGPVITYSIDVDYGNLLQDVRSAFHDGISFDPDTVPTSGHNLAVFPEIIQLWSESSRKRSSSIPVTRMPTSPWKRRPIFPRMSVGALTLPFTPFIPTMRTSSSRRRAQMIGT
jgi:hypothetical protein